MANDKSDKKKDIENLDISDLYNQLIVPIELIRSQSASEGYLESRCNAFYRMIGFPVVSNSNSFYSSGYDINLNKNQSAIDKKDNVIKEIINDKSLSLKQLDVRERNYKLYSNIFSVGGFNSTALAIGSLFIRSFDKQFGSTEPLEYDKSEIQTVSQRVFELSSMYQDIQPEALALLESLGLQKSIHTLKPFIVDPRIRISPSDNLVAAPFPKDASEIKKFGNASSFPRPYIERVISIRCSNQNTSSISPNLKNIINNIKNDKTIVDSYLLDVANNPQSEMQTSDITIFGSYLKLLRSIINSLVFYIKEILHSRQIINFQPVPDAKLGLEGILKLAPIDDNDIENNKKVEKEILNLFKRINFESRSHLSDDALNNGSSDIGGFVFSGFDDIIFSADKVNQLSSENKLEKLKNNRDAIGNRALESLKFIEYIMGEFSGLGLIDIVAIQSAFWLINKDSLLGLIDDYAYDRMAKSRPNIKSDGRNNDVIACLSEYEEKLKQVYEIIQLHFDQVWNGKAFNSQ